MEYSAFWPGKNHKYFEKRKLCIDYWYFSSLTFSLKICFNIKVLISFVIIKKFIVYGKMFSCQFFLLLQIFNSKWKGAYLLLPFDLIKPFLGIRYESCFGILTLFLKSNWDYIVMISHFGQKSQIKHQTCFSIEARMHLWYWIREWAWSIILWFTMNDNYVFNILKVS